MEGDISELSDKLNSQNNLRAIMTVPAELSAANYHVESNKEHSAGDLIWRVRSFANSDLLGKGSCQCGSEKCGALTKRRAPRVPQNGLSVSGRTRRLPVSD